MDAIWIGYPPRLRRHADISGVRVKATKTAVRRLAMNDTIVPSSRLSWRLLISARVAQEQEWGEDPRALGFEFWVLL
jgi:hypothetical protein